MTKRSQGLAIALATLGTLVSVVVGVVLLRARARRDAADRGAYAAPPPVLAPIAVAPVAPPSARPMVGPEGADPYGYPTQTADKLALRSLLWHRRYDELTRYIESFQADFEADPRREYQPIDALDAFATADPRLAPRFDEWVAASPRSFAPIAARGVWHFWTGVTLRGSASARETHPARFDAMFARLRLGRRDLERALELRPRLVAAYRRLITLDQHAGERRAQALLTRALAVCPTCYQVRESYITTLRPQWGGSIEAIHAAVEAHADPSVSPRLALLRAYPHALECRNRRLQRDFVAARAACDRALAIGDHWRARQERALLLDATGDPTGALADLDRADALTPQVADLLFARSRVHAQLQRWDAAARDLLTALRLDPVEDRAREDVALVVQGLVWVAQGSDRAGGDPASAVRLLDLALELAPSDRAARHNRASILRREARAAGDAGGASDGGASDGGATGARTGEDAVYALRVRDYALAARGDFAGVVAMWTAYLATAPGDARAYFERAGAYHQLRDEPHAREDLERACGLGLGEACELQSRVQPP